MFKRAMWLIAAGVLITGSFAHAAPAKKAQAIKPAVQKTSPAAPAEESSSEAGLDLTLRSSAAAMTATTADGSPLQTPASHMYLLDYHTGAVLAEKAGDQKMYPSSMTKIMTLYLVFDRLKQGTLSANSQFTVSEKAWRIQGSKMFVPLGEQVALEDLIRGIAIQSGNDACIVVAEGIAGSEAAFAQQMNETATKLGMTGSNFVDASGWPNADHVTTAHDLAVLGAALIRDFPQYYPYVSEREYTYHGIRQYNRNLLLNNTALGVDGIKTGHTDAAGYGIVLAAKDPATGRRLILVVNGLDSEKDRASEGERLLNWGFRNFDNRVLFKAGSTVATADVWMGKKKTVALTVAQDVIATVPKLGRDKIQMTKTYNAPVAAPVMAGQPMGTLTIVMPNGVKQEVPLVAAAQVEELSFFARIPRALGL